MGQRVENSFRDTGSNLQFRAPNTAGSLVEQPISQNTRNRGGHGIELFPLYGSYRQMVWVVLKAKENQKKHSNDFCIETIPIEK